MIRRDVGDAFLLIAQHDHAYIAGQLAELFGNGRFARPEPFEPTILGVAMHDSGWPLHDDEPTLNAHGLPLDVFESPARIAIKVWTASADRAAAQHPYAGLLTSLHVLSLSVFATTQTSFEHEKFDTDDRSAAFAVAKFQQHELERQQNLRALIGLRTDRPTHHKIAAEGMQKAEDLLTFNIRMLQAMDMLSLAACCTKAPAEKTQDVFEKPGGTKLQLTMQRVGDDLKVDPWPFAESEIELKIPSCRLGKEPFHELEDFHAAFKASSAEVITCRVHPADS
jgi:hypothetical protein